MHTNGHDYHRRYTMASLYSLFTHTLGYRSPRVKTVHWPLAKVAEVAPEPESVSTPGQERPTKKVTFRDAVFSSENGSDYIDSNPSLARSSLNSIDFEYIGHLAGPGTTPSQLNTGSRLIVEETNVSKVAMDARCENLKK
ncbi:hypothetical protein EDD21DRAFT_352210 [Dissophora ornata]|nr:hypothetical protein EDD21DRAFT_352210 [Dissophora ornata]